MCFKQDGKFELYQCLGPMPSEYSTEMAHGAGCYEVNFCATIPLVINSYLPFVLVQVFQWPTDGMGELQQGQQSKVFLHESVQSLLGRRKKHVIFRVPARYCTYAVYFLAISIRRHQRSGDGYSLKYHKGDHKMPLMHRDLRGNKSLVPLEVHG